MHLSQKQTCKRCRAYYTDFRGEHCDLGYQCEGLAPLEECYKPEHIGDYLYLMRLRQREIVDHFRGVISACEKDKQSLLVRAEAAERERDELLRELTCNSYREADFLAGVNQYADLLEEVGKERDQFAATSKKVEAENQRLREALERIASFGGCLCTTEEVCRVLNENINIARSALNGGSNE